MGISGPSLLIATPYMVYITDVLPLIVKSTVDIFRNPNPARSIIRSDVDVVTGSVMGNSISLQPWVPDQGARVNSVGEQTSSYPRGTFISGDIDDRLRSVRKHNLKLTNTLLFYKTLHDCTTGL